MSRIRELKRLYPCGKCGAPTVQQPLCGDCRVEQFEIGVYIPSPSTIRKLCLKFQEGWTEDERRTRLAGTVETVPASTPIIRSRDVFA